MGSEINKSTKWCMSVEVGWWILNFIVLFFKTMFSPSLTKHGNSHTSDYRAGQGPPPPPKRRMGGFRGGAGSPQSPPMGGG